MANPKNKILLAILIILAASFILVPVDFTEHDFYYYSGGYPKLANLYWKAPITMDEAEKLAKWDLLVLDMSAQNHSAEAIKKIRQLNPHIIILAYVSFTELPQFYLNVKEPDGEGVWHDFASGIKKSWYLKTYDGRQISWWADNRSINPCGDANGKLYRDYAADFFNNEIMGSGLWNGLFFDTTSQEIAWVDAKMDIDGDRKPDSKEKINSGWFDCHQEFFNSLRNKIGNKKFIVTNGDGRFTNTNGRMLEGFPEIYEGGWTGSMQSYFNHEKSSSSLPHIDIINSDTDNTGNNTYYRAIRFTLASTLMADGYYSYDFGPNLREQFWTYDEYTKHLGKPTSDAFNIYDKDATTITDGTWRRDFEGGIAIVNATNTTSTIKLGKQYQKIDGTIDPNYNNGVFLDEIQLEPWDGVILLDPKTASYIPR